MSKLVEFRVIDIGQELKDTAETGEGSVVGHEAIALRPVVLRKLDDRFYTPDEIAAQSELPDGYYGFPQGENKGEDIRVRQITYVIDRNATEKGDIAEFLKDPAFALKYLNEDILTRTKYPADWMDERSAEELTRLYELDETRFKQSEVVKSFRRAKLRSAAWFHKALAKEERVVRVMARERIGWQEKTDRVLEKVVPHESFVKFYLDEYLPYLLSDDGFYDITEKDLKIEQENAIRKLRQYGFSSSSSVEGLY